MKDYNGPCYPLSEAKELLGLSDSELRYKVDTGSIDAVVYTKSREMLLFLYKPENQWIGYAKCQYRGHYSLHINSVQRLFDNSSIRLAQGWGQLLDINGISNLSTAYPFKMQLPHAPFIAWRDLGGDNITQYINRLLATPFPFEHEPGLKAFEDMIAGFAEEIGKEKSIIDSYKKVYDGPDLVLDFKKNSKFTIDDLRIPVSEIDRYKETQRIAAREEKLLSSASTISIVNSQRENQLHSLIERILTKHPSFKAKEVWRLLEKDSLHDDPIFDTEKVIQIIDSDCIEWRSRYGTERSLSWDSFPPLLSRIKKRILSSI